MDLSVRGDRGGVATPAAEMKELFEQRLHALVDTFPGSLGPVARHAVLSGGKRLRPLLCLHSCVAFGGPPESAVPLALALELIHCMSLIHDDLPALDDAGWRRGQPSCHRQFGEAAALLAGDALLALSFGVLAETRSAPPELILTLIRELSTVSGFGGMAGAQAAELQANSDSCIVKIVEGKTAGLFALACSGGARLGGADLESASRLEAVGLALGHAFQALDDLRDTCPQSLTGKDCQQDFRHSRPSMLVRYGADETRARFRQRVEQAESGLSFLGEAGRPLRALIHSVAGSAP